MRQPWGPLVNAVRTLFRGEEIQKSKWGDGKDLKEFELYLPVLGTGQEGPSNMKVL